MLFSPTVVLCSKSLQTCMHHIRNKLCVLYTLLFTAIGYLYYNSRHNGGGYILRARVLLRFFKKSVIQFSTHFSPLKTTIFYIRQQYLIKDILLRKCDKNGEKLTTDKHAFIMFGYLVALVCYFPK